MATVVRELRPIMLRFLTIMLERSVIMLKNPMEPATVLSISIGSILLAITTYAVYTAFGPPSAQLSAPFEDHED